MNISIVEFLVYGLIAYPSLLAVIFSATKEAPKRSTGMTLVRSMYFVPGVICFLLLAGSGVNIFLDTTTITTNATSDYEVLDNTNAIIILNSTVLQTETTEPSMFVLQNPIWILLHWLFAAILIIYILSQVLQMFMA